MSIKALSRTRRITQMRYVRAESFAITTENWTLLRLTLLNPSSERPRKPFLERRPIYEAACS
ncbi:hypothetical protein FP2506_10206 [Fulvimarina pelagi HTCC2506]|uniref:Uncharacterized protein n=1 Tax=Fulvimarina pelagi HTCC2506 TaxID=314231 RepID=Q0G555_9HYPH|nr:hypothetical protein FP2506_10206 [Fulvimarina pelagi HTCC2506]